jgi:cytochrome c-type biogenesis protein
MATVILSLLAGILTIAAPCTLPVLPILLGSSVGQTNRARPVFIALGFVTSFSLVAIVFGAITRLLGIEQDTLRTIAVALLLVFGLLMVCPHPLEWVSARVGIFANRGGATIVRSRGGYVGGFVLGTTLGLVWTPCAGPVLGSILTVIATSSHVGGEALLLIVYAIGAAVPMLVIAYGGQFVTTRVKRVACVSHRLQQGFGVLVIVFAVATYFQYDAVIAARFSDFYPNGLSGL